MKYWTDADPHAWSEHDGPTHKIKNLTDNSTLNNASKELEQAIERFNVISALVETK